MRIIIALLLLPTIASAQTVNIGCFVTDDSGYCSTTPIACDLYSDALNTANYGESIANVCSDLAYLKGYQLGCDLAKSTLVTLANAKTVTIRRLRRACGTKCKRIK